jgi:pimeloyl-ACP methyl ester carboxylesterase
MTAATDGHFAQLQQELLDLYEVRARSRFVELAQPQMRAHVLEAGDGPPVVFLHGGDGEAVTWAPLLAQLQDDVHLYGPDRPGFGLSDRFKYRTVDLRRHAGDFTVSLLDALGLQSAVLMGGSMGGFFALATALDHPERVSSLILMGIPAGFTPKLPLPVRVIFNMPVLPGLFIVARPRSRASTSSTSRCSRPTPPASRSCTSARASRASSGPARSRPGRP